MIKRLVKKRDILYYKRDKNPEEYAAWDVYSRIYEIISEIAWFESRCEEEIAFHTINHTYGDVLNYLKSLPYISERIRMHFDGKLNIKTLEE